MGANTGETLQERSKGKDVRTSNIVAAKVRSLGSGDRYLWGILQYLVLENGRIGSTALSNFWPVGRRGAVWMRAGLAAGTGGLPLCRCSDWILLSIGWYLTSISLHLHTITFKLLLD